MKKVIQMKKIAFTAVGIMVFQFSHALVTSPNGSRAGLWSVEWKTTLERGKVEPNENRSSFQSARIDIHQIGISKGLDGPSFGADHFARVDFKYLRSGEEAVAGQTFYEADSGKSLSLTYGFNFIHEPSFASGVYFSLSPLIDFNKDKFSVPRIDLWSLGFKTSVELNERFFIEESLHYGSGIPGKHNSYLAFSHFFALRASALILKAGPYAEMDTNERTDAKYDTAFSPAGTQDRIRAMKVGVISSLEAPLSKNAFGAFSYVQKLGGYDAAATNAFSLSIGYQFE